VTSSWSFILQLFLVMFPFQWISVHVGNQKLSSSRGDTKLYCVRSKYSVPLNVDAKKFKDVQNVHFYNKLLTWKSVFCYSRSDILAAVARSKVLRCHWRYSKWEKVFISLPDQGDIEWGSNLKKLWAVDLWKHSFIHSLVFSLRGLAGRNQSPVMWPLWLWHTASWTSSWG
jgi:hypothetical protein